MKVLVHLYHGVDKSYMLNFGKRITKGAIKNVLHLGQNDAARAIYGYAEILGSVQKVEVPGIKKKRAGLEADFVVGRQFTVSRPGGTGRT